MTAGAWLEHKMVDCWCFVVCVSVGGRDQHTTFTATLRGNCTTHHKVTTCAKPHLTASSLSRHAALQLLRLQTIKLNPKHPPARPADAAAARSYTFFRTHTTHTTCKSQHPPKTAHKTKAGTQPQIHFDPFHHHHLIRPSSLRLVSKQGETGRGAAKKE